MKLNIIRIGNSLGIRLPRSLITQCKFGKTIQAKVKNHSLILTPDEPENPRLGWNLAFKKMAERGDDKLIDPTVFELSSDESDWSW